MPAGLVQLTDGLKHISQIVVRFGIVGLTGHSLLQTRDGKLQSSLLRKSDTQATVDLGGVGRRLEDLPIKALGRLHIACGMLLASQTIDFLKSWHTSMIAENRQCWPANFGDIGGRFGLRADWPGTHEHHHRDWRHAVFWLQCLCHNDQVCE